ncbi:unnamed protein product [Amoebophrya sp. A120]|nr:unnamed protein product [Amoebophrya sp. A120]|eukprot:GSA120T00008308001.1
MGSRREEYLRRRTSHKLREWVVVSSPAGREGGGEEGTTTRQNDLHANTTSIDQNAALDAEEDHRNEDHRTSTGRGPPPVRSTSSRHNKNRSSSSSSDLLEEDRQDPVTVSKNFKIELQSDAFGTSSAKQLLAARSKQQGPSSKESEVLSSSIVGGAVSSASNKNSLESRIEGLKRETNLMKQKLETKRNARARNVAWEVPTTSCTGDEEQVEPKNVTKNTNAVSVAPKRPESVSRLRPPQQINTVHHRVRNIARSDQGGRDGQRNTKVETTHRRMSLQERNPNSASRSGASSSASSSEIETMGGTRGLAQLPRDDSAHEVRAAGLSTSSAFFTSSSSEQEVQVEPVPHPTSIDDELLLGRLLRLALGRELLGSCNDERNNIMHNLNKSVLLQAVEERERATGIPNGAASSVSVSSSSKRSCNSSVVSTSKTSSKLIYPGDGSCASTSTVVVAPLSTKQAAGEHQDEPSLTLVDASLHLADAPKSPELLRQTSRLPESSNSENKVAGEGGGENEATSSKRTATCRKKSSKEPLNTTRDEVYAEEVYGTASTIAGDEEPQPAKSMTSASNSNSKEITSKLRPASAPAHKVSKQERRRSSSSGSFTPVVAQNPETMTFHTSFHYQSSPEKSETESFLDRSSVRKGEVVDVEPKKKKKSLTLVPELQSRTVSSGVVHRGSKTSTTATRTSKESANDSSVQVVVPPPTLPVRSTKKQEARKQAASARQQAMEKYAKNASTGSTSTSGWNRVVKQEGAELASEINKDPSISATTKPSMSSAKAKTPARPKATPGSSTRGTNAESSKSALQLTAAEVLAPDRIDADAPTQRTFQRVASSTTEKIDPETSNSAATARKKCSSEDIGCMVKKEFTKVQPGEFSVSDAANSLPPTRLGSKIVQQEQHQFANMIKAGSKEHRSCSSSKNSSELLTSSRRSASSSKKSKSSSGCVSISSSASSTATRYDTETIRNRKLLLDGLKMENNTTENGGPVLEEGGNFDANGGPTTTSGTAQEDVVNKVQWLLEQFATEVDAIESEVQLDKGHGEQGQHDEDNQNYQAGAATTQRRTASRTSKPTLKKNNFPRCKSAGVIDTARKQYFESHDDYFAVKNNKILDRDGKVVQETREPPVKILAGMKQEDHDHDAWSSSSKMSRPRTPQRPRAFSNVQSRLLEPKKNTRTPSSAGRHEDRLIERQAKELPSGETNLFSKNTTTRSQSSTSLDTNRVAKRPTTRPSRLSTPTTQITSDVGTEKVTASSDETTRTGVAVLDCRAANRSSRTSSATGTTTGEQIRICAATTSRVPSSAQLLQEIQDDEKELPSRSKSCYTNRWDRLSTQRSTRNIKFRPALDTPKEVLDAPPPFSFKPTLRATEVFKDVKPRYLQSADEYVERRHNQIHLELLEEEEKRLRAEATTPSGVSRMNMSQSTFEKQNTTSTTAGAAFARDPDHVNSDDEREMKKQFRANPVPQFKPQHVKGQYNHFRLQHAARAEKERKEQLESKMTLRPTTLAPSPTKYRTRRPDVPYC